MIKIDQNDLVRTTGSTTFAEKMSNPAFMSVCIIGDSRQMRSLYGKMLRLQNREKPLVENGFFYPKRWLGNLVTRLGGDWQKVFCRGTWDNLKMNGKTLSFFTETAWQAPFDLLLLIQKVYPGLEIFFAAEGDGWDTYLTNDADGRFFKCRYELDMPPENDYHNTIEEVAERIGAYIGLHIEPTKEAVYDAIDSWEKTNEDLDAYINLKEFEVVSLDQVTQDRNDTTL